MKTLALALLTTVLISGAAPAQDVTLRLSHWVPPTHPIDAKSLTPWTEAITAASGGTIKFEIVPAGQLGKPEDHYDLARDGIADVAWLNPGINAGRSTAMPSNNLKSRVSCLRRMPVAGQQIISRNGPGSAAAGANRLTAGSASSAARATTGATDS